MFKQHIKILELKFPIMWKYQLIKVICTKLHIIQNLLCNYYSHLNYGLIIWGETNAL